MPSQQYEKSPQRIGTIFAIIEKDGSGSAAFPEPLASHEKTGFGNEGQLTNSLNGYKHKVPTKIFPFIGKLKRIGIPKFLRFNTTTTTKCRCLLWYTMVQYTLAILQAQCIQKNSDPISSIFILFIYFCGQLAKRFFGDKKRNVQLKISST